MLDISSPSLPANATTCAAPPGVAMPSLYAQPLQQPSMHASLPPFTFPNMGGIEIYNRPGHHTTFNTGLGTLPYSNGDSPPPSTGLGTLLSSNVVLGHPTT